MRLRRLLVIGGAVALTIEGAHEMYLVFAVNGVTALAIFVLALFLALFAWIALSFTSALAGFCLPAVRAAATGSAPAADAPLPRCNARTALLMPTYNEQPARVMAALAGDRRIAARGPAQADAFDIFILSDTTDPDIWIAEEAALPGAARAHRRMTRRSSIGDGRRTPRARPATSPTGCARFGGAYPQMLMLDADSLMTGADYRAAGRRDGAASGCRPDPDPADHHRRADPVRARAAVRRPGLRPADRARHRLVARRRGQLLGPQRDHPHARLRRAGRAAGAARPQAVRRPRS